MHAEAAARTPTEDHHGGRGAPSPRHDVTGQAGVVARIGQSRLVDDEVVVGAGDDVVVGEGAQRLLVLQPLHLQETPRVDGNQSNR